MERKLIWESPNKKWKINKVIHPRTYRVRIEITDGFISELPIYYDYDGKIAYDYPERIPKYIREKAESIIRKMVAEGAYGQYMYQLW